LTATPSLLTIIAYARSGALDYACKLFLEGGFELVDDDPAVLSVRGRLLKDRALAASGAERRRLYEESAEAYAKAGEIGGQTYPLINAATLSLLAGKREQSRAAARKLLAHIAAGGDAMETPYYRAATHAEALLLLGDVGKAKKALAEAIALAPKAYEDHASTLRQFGMILRELGRDAAWLDPLRPPRTLHFAGHMAVSPNAQSVKQRIRAIIAKERIAFGYGALAAGADMLIAEALLEAGAELHIVLPAPVERFRALSVTGFGEGWPEKFDAILARATTVRAIAGAPEPLIPHAIQLAGEVAMGRAVMQASTLMTEAVQLILAAGETKASRPSGVTGGIAAQWKKSGRRQHILAAPRIRVRPKPEAKDSRAPALRLAALLRVDLAEADPTRLTRELLPALKAALARAPKPLFPPRWTGEALICAYAAPAPAARAAFAAAAALGSAPRIAAHYVSMLEGRDPFSARPFAAGPAPALLAQLVGSIPSGAVHVTEDFAAALHAGPARSRPRTEYVGDLPAEPDPIRLFALKP
jgi:tetratricopeptide (TPR) repeat protein